MNKTVNKSTKSNLTNRRSEFSLYLTPRYILGLILIISSFTSAYMISKVSDKTVKVWAATVELAQGEIINDSDVTEVRVRLLDNPEQYLSATTPITGTAVLRPIGAAELIPSFAITSDIDTKLQVVPISIPREWAPIEISSGSVVDIYGIPNSNVELQSDRRTMSRLLLSKIAIDSVDISSRDLGGRIGVSLLVPEFQVPTLVSAVNQNDFLLVRRSN